MERKRKKKAVIIGGGFAGSLAAKKLQHNFDVTLIDTKDYFEFTPGILRTIVDPRHIKCIHIRHKDYLNEAKIIHGEVKEANKNYVSINDKKIKFDYLLICSGSYYSNPIKQKNIVMASRGDELLKHYTDLKRAKDVLIIGGGPVGVEIAAEICTSHPEKNIVIVHAGKRIIERSNKKAADYALNFMKRKNIKIIYNEKVLNERESETFVTDKGTKIHADIAFVCTGITPHFEFMKKNFKGSLDEHNHIKVNDYLQLEGYKNIFAAGDVNNTHVEKTGQNAQLQAKVAASNILHLENNKKPVKYHARKTPYVLSLGKWRGVFEYKNFTLTGLIPGILKGVIEKKEMWTLKYL